MDTELEIKPDMSEINIGVEELSTVARTKYTSEDISVIKDIISNFEDGWIETELCKPNNGVKIREKRVWPQVAEEFNKRQGKRISADQLRRRFNCNNSIFKKKTSEHVFSGEEDILDFIKSKINQSADPEFLTISKSTLSNKRAEHFLLKSNLEPVSVWSALLIQALRDLIQARYLVEDGLLMLKNRQHSIGDTKDIEASVEKVEDVKDINVPRDLNIKSSSSNIKNDVDQDLYNITSLHDAIDKVLEGIKKYSYIEQFLELSIESEDELTSYRFTNDNNSKLLGDLKNEETGFNVLQHIYSDVEVTAEFDRLSNFDLKEDISNDDDWDPEKNDMKNNPSSDHDDEKSILKKSIKRKKIVNGKVGKARGKRRKFDESLAVITCEHCGEVCNTKRKFYNHMRKHLQDNAVICKVCNKGFQYKSQYELHFRKHTGERPYRCHVCAAGFTQKNVLVDHLRTHSGEKPFKCEVCFLEFTQRSNLKSHMTIHSGEKPFKCDKCTKSFRLKDSLREHESLHTGVKAFKCDQCLKEFRVKGKLRKHLRKQHNITVFPKDND